MLHGIETMLTVIALFTVVNCVVNCVRVYWEHFCVQPEPQGRRRRVRDED